MRQSHSLKFIFLCLLMGIQLSCKKEDRPVPTKQMVNKMVLVYMEANNDLRYEALNSINQMESAAANLDGVLLVYIKTSSVRAYLLKIKYDTDLGKITSDTIKTFTTNASADTELMKDVISYAQNEYPAQKYGLVLWSHATAWAPAPSSYIATKSFGRDAGAEIDIIDLKNALPNNLEFILFDACSMGGVEVLFEFKDKAEYILASPAETLAESFPYGKITPLLFQDADHLKQVAESYYAHYNAYPDDRQSATVVLVKTSELLPLAKQMKALMESSKAYGDSFERQHVQRLDFTSGFPVASYDFVDFLDHNFLAPDLAALKQQLTKTLLYKQATAKFLGVPISTFSGLSCYIPEKDDRLLSYYKRLAWYKSSGFSLLFEH